MRSIAALPRQWFEAGAPYDHRTGRFQGPGGNAGFSNLNGVFGVAEMNAELLALVDEPAYRKAWLQYCRTYNAPKEEIVALLGRDPGGRGMSDTNSRMTAYAAFHERDRALSLRAWREFFQSSWLKPEGSRTRRIEGAAVLRPLVELAQIGTNGSAQWGLAAIQHMALGADTLDEAARAARLVP